MCEVLFCWRALAFLSGIQDVGPDIWSFEAIKIHLIQIATELLVRGVQGCCESDLSPHFITVVKALMAWGASAQF